MIFWYVNNLSLSYFEKINKQLDQKDVDALINSFYNINLTRERGVYFDEELYKCLRADENSIYAKDSKDGKKGIVLVRTKKCILMGTYKENMYPSVCVEAVEKLAEYFKLKQT
jgi:profilin